MHQRLRRNSLPACDMLTSGLETNCLGSHSHPLLMTLSLQKALSARTEVFSIR
jgi:hypothetical protein